jgi:hypothetical protein
MFSRAQRTGQLTQRTGVAAPETTHIAKAELTN